MPNYAFLWVELTQRKPIMETGHIGFGGHFGNGFPPK